MNIANKLHITPTMNGFSSHSGKPDMRYAHADTTKNTIVASIDKTKPNSTSPDILPLFKGNIAKS